MNEEEIREMQEEAERREKARQERGDATDEQLNQAYKELQNPKDPRREEKFLKERAKRKKAEEEGDDPNIAGTAGGLGFEVAAGVATDKATSFLLNPLLGPKGIALYGLANFASGAVANAIAQRMRGDTSFSLGEILASGAAGVIPGTTAKLGKKGSKIFGKANTIKRAGIAGGLTGVGSEQIRVGIDEKRPLTFNEAALAGAVGGTASASLQRIARGASNIANDYYQRLQDEAMPVLAMTINSKDVPRNAASTWRTAGQKSQPLNFLFGDKAGWRGGLLNIKSWRERGADKNIAEQFLTAQDKGVPFSSERDKQNLFMTRVFGMEGARQLLNLPPGTKRIFQAHHNTATKAVLTGQEGLTYDSPYYHEIQKVWEDLNLTLGNNPDNIIGTLGLVQRDLNSPHSLIHKFLDSKMGPDGTKFWTEDIMKQIVIYDNAGNAIGHKNFDLRVEKTKEQALIFKEAVDLLKLSHQQFYLAKGVKPGEYLTTEPIFDEEIVDSFINKLPPKGGTGQYTTDVISRIAREVAEETDIKPVIKSGSLKQLIEEQVSDDIRAKLDGMYRFAVNQSNGEDMLIDVIFNNMKPKDAIRKYRGNDPAADLLEKELKEAVRYNRQALKQLYQIKFGEIPPAVTKFDKGADE
jgi:hypothetical protein